MRLRISLGAMLLALVSSAPLQASIIPTLNGNAPVSVGGGVLQYNYTATIASDQTVVLGSFLTLFDLVGLLPGSGTVSDPGFTISTPPTGLAAPGPPAVVVPDSPAILNFVLTRTSATPLVGQQDFFFSFRATGTPDFRFFNGQATTTANGLQQSNGGQVLGPGVAAAAIPEPSVTVMLGVAGLLGLGCRTIRRRQAAV